jgi:hypothetical protein
MPIEIIFEGVGGKEKKRKEKKKKKPTFLRDGLIKLAELEEGIEHADEETKRQIKKDVAELVARKFQIIIALQIYNPDKLTDDWTAARNTAFLRMLKY